MPKKKTKTESQQVSEPAARDDLFVELIENDSIE
jgi:hypothetical protein